MKQRIGRLVDVAGRLYITILKESSILAIIFIVLKLVGVINWAWIWVLLPVWGGCVFAIVVILIFVILSFLVTK